MAEYIEKEAVIRKIKCFAADVIFRGCKLENLEWCTAAYNRTYGKAVERHAKKLRGRKSEKRVAVVGCTLDGKYEEWFPSIAEAAKIVNGSTSAISKVCKGERKMAYGYRWSYADDFCSCGERKDGGK